MKSVVLGGSKGLGLALVQELRKRGNEALSISRANHYDFSKVESWNETVDYIQNIKPNYLFYSAGGGPYGRYQEKDFSSHEWTWNVNFKFPAFLLHAILSKPQNWPHLQAVCFVGSQVADQKPDPMAASYAAAKHALRGLVTSVQLEQPNLRVELYSAPYMDTGMLPKNAWPRQQEGLVISPIIVAADLLNKLGI